MGDVRAELNLENEQKCPVRGRKLFPLRAISFVPPDYPVMTIPHPLSNKETITSTDGVFCFPIVVCVSTGYSYICERETGFVSSQPLSKVPSDTLDMVNQCVSAAS